MGKFSGILICSDFDGTLALNAHVVEKNIQAINYFKENGGLFSVITGRTVDFLRSRSNEVESNTFVGCVNGTVIYDYPNGKPVSEDYLQGDIFTPLVKIRKEFDFLKSICVFRTDGDHIISVFDDGFETQLRDTLSLPVLKVIIISERPYEDGELERIRELLGEEFEQARSWKTGLEIQNRGINKGRAAHKIATLAGAKTLICVGDYENDLPLLAAADVSYAVSNALSSLKAIADRITVDVSEGAIAAIIEDLEKRM